MAYSESSFTTVSGGTLTSNDILQASINDGYSDESSSDLSIIDPKNPIIDDGCSDYNSVSPTIIRRRVSLSADVVIPLNMLFNIVMPSSNSNLITKNDTISFLEKGTISFPWLYRNGNELTILRAYYANQNDAVLTVE